MFNFTHKAFVKLVSSRRGGASGGPAAAPAGAAATPSQGAEKDITPASGSKKGRKSRKAAEAAAAAAAAAAEQQATAASKGPQDVREDTRHLSVDLLCAFMDSGELPVYWVRALALSSDRSHRVHAHHAHTPPWYINGVGKRCVRTSERGLAAGWFVLAR